MKVMKGTVKNSKTPMNKENTRVTKGYRFLEIDVKRLKRIASVKKATQTKVLTELIRLAYAGLFLPEMKALDKFYKEVVNIFEDTENKKHREIKRTVPK